MWEENREMSFNLFIIKRALILQSGVYLVQSNYFKDLLGFIQLVGRVYKKNGCLNSSALNSIIRKIAHGSK